VPLIQTQPAVASAPTKDTVGARPRKRDGGLLQIPGGVREQADDRELCDLLLCDGVVSGEMLAAALASRQRTGRRLSSALLSGCHLSAEAMRIVLDYQVPSPPVTLTAAPLDEDAREMLTLDLASEHGCVPFAFCAGELRVAFHSAPDERTLQELEAVCAHRIAPYVTSARAINAYTAQLYDSRPHGRRSLSSDARPRPVLHGVHSAKPEVWRPLGAMLIRRGMISPDVLREALGIQRRTGRRLGTILVAGRLLSERALLEVLSEQMQVPAVTLAGRPVDDSARELLGARVCAEHGCVPFELSHGLLHVAFDDGPSEQILLELERICSVRVEPHLASSADVRNYTERVYGKARHAGDKGAEVRFSRFDTCTSTHRDNKRFADVLVARNLVAASKIDAALGVQMRTRQRLATVLLAGGELSQRAVLAVLSESQRVAETSLAVQHVDQSLAKLIAPELARSYRCVPFARDATLLDVAFAASPTELILLELEQGCETAIRPYLAAADELFQFALRLYGDTFDEAPADSSADAAPAAAAGLGRRLSLGELLVMHGLLSAATVEEALLVQRRTGQRLGEILVQGGQISEQALAQVLAKQLQVPTVSLVAMPVSENARDLIPAGLAQAFSCVPFALSDRRLSVAFTVPPTERCLQVLEEHFHVQIDPYVCWPEEFESYAARLYGRRYLSAQMESATSKAAA
jgi:hypothetical protein